jgi:predicted O-methyltransferase YrrM
VIHVEGTFGGLHGDEIKVFQQVLAGVEGQGVEIGCLDGFSTVVILDSSKLRLTSVDPFIPDSMSPNLVGSQARFHANTKPYGERSRLLVAYSWNVAPGWTEPLDFLFLDGDHTWAAVKRDYDDWTPKLKIGGILAMHDARMSRGGASFHPGPSHVADSEIFARPDRWQVLGEAFSLVVARKL